MTHYGLMAASGQPGGWGAPIEGEVRGLPSAPGRRAFKPIASRLPWVEIAITLFTGVLFYFPLKNPDLAKLTWAIGAILASSRVIYEVRLMQELAPVRKLAEVTDLTQQTSIDELRNLQRIYLAITEPEFRHVKDSILAESTDALLQLANEKKSAPLPAGEYYAWLLPMIDGAASGSKIWALSVMMDCEWDDSPTERLFLEKSIAAAKRGVFIERVFVIEEGSLGKALNNPAIRAQAKEEDPQLFRGYLVRRDYLRRQDSLLHGRLGNGFIAFDDRVALIDLESSEGQMRGQVTMNSAEIARLVRLHDQLLLHSEELSIAKHGGSVLRGTE